MIRFMETRVHYPGTSESDGSPFPDPLIPSRFALSLCLAGMSDLLDARRDLAAGVEVVTRIEQVYGEIAGLLEIDTILKAYHGTNKGSSKRNFKRLERELHYQIEDEKRLFEQSGFTSAAEEGRLRKELAVVLAQKLGEVCGLSRQSGVEMLRKKCIYRVAGMVQAEQKLSWLRAEVGESGGSELHSSEEQLRKCLCELTRSSGLGVLSLDDLASAGFGRESYPFVLGREMAGDEALALIGWDLATGDEHCSVMEKWQINKVILWQVVAEPLLGKLDANDLTNVKEGRPLMVIKPAILRPLLSTRG